jgi:predicted acetyltransferase
MEELVLLEPSSVYYEQIKEYRQEFLEAGDSMDGTSSLREYDNPSDWMEHIRLYSRKETIPEGRVPGTIFLCVRKNDDKLIGMINVRHELSEYLYNYGGNIGYSIRPSERRNGYAKEMLRLALPYCRDNLGLSKVMISCDVGNEGSRKTILANGGVYENTLHEPDEDIDLERYWISLN